ncbi:hypothetical protein [Clostridiisalibacter paucivorans]|nr:hypothetical protein [Clostridiisalibacter paucivorans]
MSRPYVTISINNQIHEERIILNKEKLHEIVRSVIIDLKLI